MEDITIKSVTHCPTCGSECKVEGGTTHRYIPIKKYTEEDMLFAFVHGGTKFEENKDADTLAKNFKKLINSLKRLNDE